MPGRIFIVDDDERFVRALERLLRREGHDVLSCGTAAEARAQFPGSNADVAVLDYQLPDADGLGLLDELRPDAAGAVFLMATAYPDIEIAVDAMRRGAFDFVAKDLDLRECLMRIDRGCEVALLRRRMAEASHTDRGSDEDLGLLGESSAMRTLRARIDALSSADDTTVLISGETGTGKGVVARVVHARSGRAYEPFVAVDCTTIAVTLVESELFGHEKGAFSGAINAKMGRVEAAGRGTLFLDEIGELELGMQAKLLRLLEEREYTRVGGTRARNVLARIVTATNRDLETAVAEGWFRANLRYRLEVFVLSVPPLRDRGDDVFLLTAHFASERARALGRKEPRLHPEVIATLPRYPFPGNVRELRNMVEQAVLLAEGEELTLTDFPVLHRVAGGWSPQLPGSRARARPASGPGGEHWPSGPATGQYPAPWAQAPPSWPPTGPYPVMPPQQTGTHPMAPVPSEPAPPRHTDPGEGRITLESIRRDAEADERQALLDALRATGGNVSAAARRLGLSRYQILRRLAKYDLR